MELKTKYKDDKTTRALISALGTLAKSTGMNDCALRVVKITSDKIRSEIDSLLNKGTAVIKWEDVLFPIREILNLKEIPAHVRNRIAEYYNTHFKTDFETSAPYEHFETICDYSTFKERQSKFVSKYEKGNPFPVFREDDIERKTRKPRELKPVNEQIRNNQNKQFLKVEKDKNATERDKLLAWQLKQIADNPAECQPKDGCIYWNGKFYSIPTDIIDTLKTRGIIS